MNPSRRSARLAAGFTLIEVLIALIVLAFGMLSVARVIGRSAQMEMEAHQRSQAMTLAAEMVDRITNNPKQAGQYVADYAPSGPAEDCAGLPDPNDLVERDKCEWRNRLRGADAFDGGRGIGSPLGARACVILASANVYVVAIAWQGLLPTEAPGSPCGAGASCAVASRTTRSPGPVPVPTRRRNTSTLAIPAVPPELQISVLCTGTCISCGAQPAQLRLPTSILSGTMPLTAMRTTGSAPRW